MIQKSDFKYKNESKKFVNRNFLLNDKIMNDVIKSFMTETMRHEMYGVNFINKKYMNTQFKKKDRMVKIMQNDTYYYKMRKKIDLHKNEKTKIKLKRVVNFLVNAKNLRNSTYFGHFCVVQNSKTKIKLNQN